MRALWDRRFAMQPLGTLWRLLPKQELPGAQVYVSQWSPQDHDDSYQRYGPGHPCRNHAHWQQSVDAQTRNICVYTNILYALLV